MSSLVNWFHKRRSLSEVNMKNKMAGTGTFRQTTAENSGRSGQGGRQKVLQKQMSWPSQPNYTAYFYLQTDEDDVLLGDHDLVFGGPSLDLMFGYKPFWKVQRRYSENSHLNNSPLFHGAQWHQLATPFGRRVPTAPGAVLDIAHTQKRRQAEKVARRKSDSLFNYVPKAFSEQDASRILFGEKRDDVLQLRPARSSQRFSNRVEIAPRQRDAQNRRPVSNSCVGLKENNASVKRLPGQTRSLDKQHDLNLHESLDLNHESLDLNQNLPEGHFYFEPSLLLDNQSSTWPTDDGGLSHVTDKDYNINCKSADDEVSTILSEFRNIDCRNGNHNCNDVGRSHGNGGKRDLLY